MRQTALEGTGLAVTIALVILSALSAALPCASACLGEFEMCATGECVLDSCLCGRCAGGQYLCPDLHSCVDGPEGYVSCPNVNGTFFDWTLPHETRLDWLIAHATAMEKISQLTNTAPAIPRLSIPAYEWLNDDEHAVKTHSATVFPNGCGLGAAWAPDTLHAIGRAIAMEARGTHNAAVHRGDRNADVGHKGITLYSPHLNTVRDPRWGRAQEVFSEDPHHTAKLTFAMVTGAQQRSDSGGFLLSGMCCKHLAAYDVDNIPSDRFSFSAEVNARNLWETHLPAFRACVVAAQAMHVMCAYNAINEVPTCGEPRLLNGLLREQWQWDGFVVSDYDAWAQLHETQYYCGDYECAAAVGLNAGMDQEGGGSVAVRRLQSALDRGSVANHTIDAAFRRLFRARLRLGMHDPPTHVPWNSVASDRTNIQSADHRALALQAAREAMTLLRNVDSTLPLNPSAKQRIALIGPHHHRDDLLLGNYALYPDGGGVSILEGILRAVGQNTTAKCTYDPDWAYNGGVLGVPHPALSGPALCCLECSTRTTCRVWTWRDGQCYQFATTGRRVNATGAVSGSCDSRFSTVRWAPACVDVECSKTSGFADATELAAQSDVVIVTLGLDQTLENEMHDRKSIALPPAQLTLLKAVREATSARVIVVLVHGGTLELAEVLANSDAVLDAWYPGQFGGTAVAEALFGLYNPAGRVAVTYYMTDRDLPPRGDTELYPIPGVSRGITYRYFTGEPQFPFGFGLSYTTFAYASLTLNGTSFGPCDTIGVSVEVTNTGKLTGDEVVQLYLSQPHATVPVPRVRLAAFKRIRSIAPGETVRVELAVEPEWHTVVYENGDTNIYDSSQVFVESGELRLWVGGGQPNTAFTAPAPLSALVTVAASIAFNQCSATTMAGAAVPILAAPAPTA